MNLAIRGIEGQIEHGDSFHNDRHPDLRADYILAKMESAKTESRSLAAQRDTLLPKLVSGRVPLIGEPVWM